MLYAVEFLHFSISIHAAREGGDDLRTYTGRDGMEFQSTPPVKAATRANIRA